MTNFRNAMMAAAQTAAGGADIVSVGNSAVFDTGQTLTKTFSTTRTDGKKWTFSVWLNLSNITDGNSRYLYSSTQTGGWPAGFYFRDGRFGYTGTTSGGYTAGYFTTPDDMFRDTTGWYHFCVIFDSTLAVAADRIILMVNNERVTTFATNSLPPADSTSQIGINGTSQIIGQYYSTSRNYLGYMAEFVFIDGTAYASTDFGQYDTTGLYWTPKSSDDIKTLTFGNNGYYLDNTTNPQTDASGKGNNFTNNGSVATTTHTATNSAAILNPLNLVVGSGAPVLNIGNTRITSTAATGYNSGALTTIPMGAGGKYYFEVYVEGLHPTTAVHWGLAVGISPFDLPRKFDSYTTVPGKSVYEGGTIDFQGSGYSFLQANAGAQNVNIAPYAPSVGQYLQCAFDSSNGKIWYGINNTWYGSGNPSTGANPASTLDVVTTWHGWIACYTTYVKAVTNFGTTAYQYTPPTGFGAVTTTAIAEATTRTASDTNKYFQTTLYEGNGAGQRVGAFQPFDNTFTVAKSALFPTSDGNLSKTFGAAGNQKKWTFSTWLKKCANGTTLNVFRTSHGNDTAIQFNSDKLQFYVWNGSSYLTNILTTPVYQDTSQWFHLVFKWDSTPSTPSASSIAFYVNGVQVTALDTAVYPSQNVDSGWNGNGAQTIGIEGTGSDWDGYMSEIVFIDNDALAASSFGQTDTSTNRWIPKDVSGLTYGTNGFYLNFSNASDLGEDQENSNDWANNNSVVQSTDSPTTNFAVLDPTFCYATPTVGNLVMDGYTSYSSNVATLGLTSGKWYWEMTCGSTVGAPMMGVVPFDQKNKAQYPGQAANGIGWDGGNTYRNNATLIGSYGSAMANGQVNAVMLDLDSTPQTITFRQANSQLATINLIVNTTWFPYFRNGGAADASNATLNFGASSFTYTPPTGFIALSQDNLAGTDQLISAMSWIKNRDATDNHMLFDRVRGIYKDLPPNDSDAEVTNVNTLQSFLEAGAQIGNDVEVNTAGESYVLWNWMIEQTGSGTSNEAGSINTTSTLVDTTLGLSISTYTGTGNNATIGHGLGVAPEMVIVRKIDSAVPWYVLHTGWGNAAQYMELDSSAAVATLAAVWNSTYPSSTVFSIGTNGVTNQSSGKYVAYCFAPSQFISIGSYEGNGNANGAFVPTINSLGIPIQPVWAITKSIDSTSNWDMYDKERLGYNPENAHLDANATTVESTADNLDIVTGGLKMRIASDPNVAETYIYMAIGTPIIDTDGRIIAGR